MFCGRTFLLCYHQRYAETFVLKCLDFGIGLMLLLQRVPATRGHHHEGQAAAGQAVLLSPCVFILDVAGLVFFNLK